MERQQMVGPEYQKEVTWLEWIFELPWSTSTRRDGSIDLHEARQKLDVDHYGNAFLVIGCLLKFGML
eukprot:m.165769 g.165769  ORF g.165769 m.165769 type:complete len:67 (+) comp15266_c0_seq5:908-1108(+)